jgi:hypothetical protein
MPAGRQGRALMRAAVAIAGAVAAALALGACGSGSSHTTTTTTRAAAPAPTVTSPSTSNAVPIPPATGHGLPTTATPEDVIRAWADSLRSGRIAAAARLFAVPTIVSNGGGPIVLRTRAAIRFFNFTLPCGAVLIKTQDAPHGLVVATFRLTERPGPGVCGTGVGQTARTAFRIRNGRIREWLRVADAPGSTDEGTPA